jgi:glutathione synthase
MDPIHSIDIDGDSTFALALEAQARGHSLFYCLPKNLSLRDGVVVARGHDLTVQRIYGDHATLGPERQVELASMDVVLLRQDPPFDMGYITSTHLLERVHPDTLVVNDPGHVRNAPEKILVTEFPELMPETLITANKDEIIAFREEYKDIILKPLYGNGGAGVFRLREGDENLNSLFEMFEEFYREPIIAQRYLPGRWQACRCDQPCTGRRRDTVKHACGRRGREVCPERARPGNLRHDRPHAQGARVDLCRDRHHRRLSDRN